MTVEMDDLWSGFVPPTISRLEEMLERLIQKMWEHRFFQREQLFLMKKDPLLVKKNHEVRKRKSVSQKNVRAGTNLILQIMRPYLSPGASTEVSEYI